MMELIKKIWERYHNFIKYCFIGVSSVCLDFIVFYLLSENTDIHYLVINIISISVGITNSFFLNAKLNFKVTDKFLIRYIKFYFVGVLGILVSNFFLFTLHEQFAVNIMISKAITIFVITVMQFTLNKKFSFAKDNV